MNILGVASGNGVLLYPLKKYLVGNIEIRTKFKTPDNIQWKLNFGDIPLYNTEIGVNRLLNNQKEKIDIIVGHPDCGHSSVMATSRRKTLKDPKVNASLNLFFKCINLYTPDIFILENLPKLLREIEFIQNAIPNYKLIPYHINFTDLGNSQANRKRLILIGIRDDKPKFYHKIFKIQPVRKLKKTGELLDGLTYPNTELCHIREKITDTITLYGGFKDTLLNIKDKWVREFKNDKRWTTGNTRMLKAPGVYKNLENEYPLTIRPANRQFNPHGEMMSPREMARIQGCPDSFKLWYDTKKSYYTINKARITIGKTPPMELGIWIKKQLKKIYE